MSRYILDTDHITLHQRGNPYISQKIEAASSDQIAVTIVSFEEQIRGQLASIRRIKGLDDLVRGYYYLHQNFAYFTEMLILQLDEVAIQHLENFRQQKVRVGTQDLRIAAIALASGRIVVTRNRRDFEKIPGIKIEDWSARIDSEPDK